MVENRVDTPAAPLVLLTGATGYVGGRLLPVLERAGVRVRCLARRPEYLTDRIEPPTEVVRGDCLDLDSLAPALAGVHTAYYLVHSLGSGGSFEEQDRRAAEHFAAAAHAAGVRRIIYLGGLGDDSQGLSAHLRSRRETGEALRATGVPVIEFRASIILGSGSLSYELIRALTERLPVMLCPAWVRTPAQPIAIEDVIAYLRAALDLPEGPGRTFEIGGTDRTSYVGIMREYAHQRGLRRLWIPVPVLTPYLSSLWLGLTTPIYARVGRKLVESLRNATVVQDDAALRVFPIRPMGLRPALARAQVREDLAIAATRWNDALSATVEPPSYGGVRFGTRLVDSRAVTVAVPPVAAFAPIRRIGGRRGWYYGNPLWRLRGFIDLLVGGVGLRRGRRDPERLALGDALDFWRVVGYEPDRRLRLVAEMRLPGRAWLQFEVAPAPGGATIRQTAIFDPAGLAGLLYWYGIYPLHARVFRGMLRAIAAKAVTWHEETCSASASSAGSATGRRPAHAAAAGALGALLARRGIGLVYGGGSIGLMGVVADAVLAAGGAVTGVIPHGLYSTEIAHAGLQDLRVVPSMHERKAVMASLADGFVALPGGLGTFEELLEMLTWLQLGIHRKPVGLLDVDGYWRGLRLLLDDGVAAGFIEPDRATLLLVDTDPEALLERMLAWTPPPGPRIWLTPSEA